MKRDIQQFKNSEFDVLVIGGGIYGAFMALDAALRGLSVALVEKNDFGSMTSANSLKIVHGGLRYLQSAGLKRMKESIRERSTLLRIAKHLVHPLPCLMPTKAFSLKGKLAMRAALFLNDLISFDRNQSLDHDKQLPNGRILSKGELRQLIPGLDEINFNGAALWYDAQIYNSERLILSVLKTAVQSGAVLANYVECKDFKIKDNRIVGIIAQDKLTDEEILIHSKITINCAGPWAMNLLEGHQNIQPRKKTKLTVGFNLIIKKQLFSKYALGISGKSRYYFLVPWKNHTLIGTEYLPFEGSPDNLSIGREKIETFLTIINQALPTMNLTYDDVIFCHQGLIPADESNHATGKIKIKKSYKIIDHQKENQIVGLLSVLGVKYTTARDIAEKTIDLALKKIGKERTPSRSSQTILHGGDVSARITPKDKLSEHLSRNHGSEYQTVLNYCKKNPTLAEQLSQDVPVIKAEVLHGIREEMAKKLSDIVFRRTELGSAGFPGEEALTACSEIMAQELEWSSSKAIEELTEVKKRFSK